MALEWVLHYKNIYFFIFPSIFFLSLCSAKKVEGAWTPWFSWFYPPCLVLIIVITLVTNRV